MDAKAKADFIHSVAGGQKIPCPNCNQFNEAGSLFCVSCGKKLGEEKVSKTVPDLPEEPEISSAFAQGLPAWDIVPPQVVVRRKKR